MPSLTMNIFTLLSPRLEYYAIPTNQGLCLLTLEIIHLSLLHYHQ